MGRQGGQQDVLVFPGASRDFDAAVDRISGAVVPEHAPAIGWIVLAVVVWIVSVVGEGIADRQLKRFTQDPANHTAVCRVGLWRYSRHPNYFFECVHWLAYIALSIGTPWGWFTLLPPVLMAFLLLKLSGIPLLEESMAKRRAGYADYMRTTSALIPWPPRH